MSTGGTLPAGFFTTQVNGQKCTAIPRSEGGGGGGGAVSTSAAVATSTAAVAATSTPDSTTAQPTVVSSQQVQAPPVVASSSSSPPPPASTSIATTPEVAAIPPPAALSSTVAPTPTPAPTSSTIIPPTTSSIISPTTSSPPIASSTAAAQTTLISSTRPVTIPISSALPESSSVISSASTASKGTTPTTSSSTPLAIAQSEVSSTPIPTPVSMSSGGASMGGFNSFAMSSPSPTPTLETNSTQAETDVGISSGRLTAAPVVGGVLGSMGFIALVALLFFFLRRRKKRGSLLTPLTTGTRTEFYRDEKSLGSAGFDQKYTSNIPLPNDRFGPVAIGLKAGLLGLGASLKSKVSRDRTNSPSVNLNRGNSQFLDGPIPTHSRNNSVPSGNGDKPTIKDRFTEWYDRVREDISWRMRMRKSNEPADPFAAARGLNEKQAKLNNPTPDFSQLLDMNDRELQLEAERRRANFEKTQSGSSLPPLGSLGLRFSSMQDPFADPIRKNTGPNPSATGRSQHSRDPFADPITEPKNPFSDPIPQPQPSVSKPTTYVTDIRRSRGQSMDATNNGRPPSTTGGPTSRYPSSIAPSVDSYRDTVFSSFSNNARKGKGRSDPFDLERPELWQRTNNQNFNPRTSGRPRGPSISNIRTSNLNGYTAPLTVNNLQANNQPGYEPHVISSAGGPRVSAGTYESKYSSGVSSMTGWGDPGPDLGPGSGNTSMRGNASSNGGSADFGRGIPPQRSGSLESRSSRGGVGKAM